MRFPSLRGCALTVLAALTLLGCESSPTDGDEGAVTLSVADYFPFGTGTAWSYVVRAGGETASLADEDTGPITVDDKTWRRVCGTGLYGGSEPDEDNCNAYRVEQGRLLARQVFSDGSVDETSIPFLRDPITPGDSWVIQNGTATVIGAGPRQVEGFQFDDVVHLRLEVSSGTPDRADVFIAPFVGLAEAEYYSNGALLGTVSLTGFVQP